MPPVSTSLRRIPTVGRPQLSPPPRNMTVTSPPPPQRPHHGHERSASTSSATTPYMVALAGWPEPVFIAEARDTWEKKHSRPPSPVGAHAKLPPLSGEIREGVRLPDRLPPLSSEVREGVSLPSTSRPSTSRQSSPSSNPSFPTSSARTTTGNNSPKSNGSSPRISGRSISPPQHSSPSHAGYVASAHAAHQSAHARAAAAARNRAFQDPRYAAGAAVIGTRGGRVALRVAPSWASAGGDATPASVLNKRLPNQRAMRPPPLPHSHSTPNSQASGPSAAERASHAEQSSARHTLGEHTHGRLMDPRNSKSAAVLLRATPEVFPKFQPVAHEVYPRDPEHWKGSPAGGSAGGSPESMEVDH